MQLSMSCHDSGGDEQYNDNRPNTVYFSVSCDRQNKSLKAAA